MDGRNLSFCGREKDGHAYLPAAVTKAEKYFNVENLADGANMTLQHHISQAIKGARWGVMKRDVDMWCARRRGHHRPDGSQSRPDAGPAATMRGLHRAIEPRRASPSPARATPLATITFQNYFPHGTKKLSGMTGTTQTEAHAELEIYGLQVVEVPTEQARGPAPTTTTWCTCKTEPARIQRRYQADHRCHERASPCWWAPFP